VMSFSCGSSIAGFGGEWLGDIPLPSGRIEARSAEFFSPATGTAIGHLTDWVI
jgi:hypothetical protein